MMIKFTLTNFNSFQLTHIKTNIHNLVFPFVHESIKPIKILWSIYYILHEEKTLLVSATKRNRKYQSETPISSHLSSESAFCKIF